MVYGLTDHETFILQSKLDPDRKEKIACCEKGWHVPIAAGSPTANVTETTETLRAVLPLFTAGLVHN